MNAVSTRTITTKVFSGLVETTNWPTHRCLKISDMGPIVEIIGIDTVSHFYSMCNCQILRQTEVSIDGARFYVIIPLALLHLSELAVSYFHGLPRELYKSRDNSYS